MNIKTLLGAMVLMAATAPAMADRNVRDAGIDAHQQQIEQRIQQGWRSGELTTDEYRVLQREVRLVKRDEQAMLRDGFLSPRERHYLHARLDDLSRDVYRQKHDGDTRGRSYNDHSHADRRF
jgi:hypothetical protein